VCFIFTSSLIENLTLDLCVSAAMASVKDAVGWTSITPPRGNADRTDQIETPAVADGVESKIQTRAITPAHFMHALDEVSASSSEGSHSELRRWHDRFGHKGTLGNRDSVKFQTTGLAGRGSEYNGKAGDFGRNLSNINGEHSYMSTTMDQGTGVFRRVINP